MVVQEDAKQSEAKNKTIGRTDSALERCGFQMVSTKGRSAFDKRLKDLMAFKAKYGHCNVSQHGEDASLGQWCSELRGSYKNMQNNQKPRTKQSDEQI
jgi:hypothetical protein